MAVVENHRQDGRQLALGELAALDEILRGCEKIPSLPSGNVGRRV
jgi:hypothetical protein